MWNRALFQAISFRDGAIDGFTYEEPFASLFSSHEGSKVDPRGFEPLTYWLPANRSTGLSYGPSGSRVYPEDTRSGRGSSHSRWAASDQSRSRS
jgi:hypothetical protein